MRSDIPVFVQAYTPCPAHAADRRAVKSRARVREALAVCQDCRDHTREAALFLAEAEARRPYRRYVPGWSLGYASTPADCGKEDQGWGRDRRTKYPASCCCWRHARLAWDRAVADWGKERTVVEREERRWW